jgi:hypothetical protein
MVALEAWPWTHPEYQFTIDTKEKVEQIAIDPFGFTADINRENNSWPQEKE